MRLRDSAVEWFWQMWPTRARRHTAMSGYRGIPEETLADIALRNYVFAPAPAAGDLFGAGVNEGRRLAALEIFKNARMDLETVWAAIERKSQTENRTP